MRQRPGKRDQAPLLTRRRVLQLGGAVSIAPLVGYVFAGDAARALAKPGKGLKFLTAREYAILDELAELIIPADERSGGARAAGVAKVIDRRLAETRDRAMRQDWRGDLRLIDRLSRRTYRRSFLRARASQRAKLLSRLARREFAPKTDGEWAFASIKWEVCDVYYHTKIGIHDEMNYQGNQLLDDFIGTDARSVPIK